MSKEICTTFIIVSSVGSYSLQHSLTGFRAQLSTLKTEGLSRSAPVHNVLILGQLGKEMYSNVITPIIKLQLCHLLKIDLFKIEQFTIIARCFSSNFLLWSWCM